MALRQANLRMSSCLLECIALRPTILKARSNNKSCTVPRCLLSTVDGQIHMWLRAAPADHAVSTHRTHMKTSRAITRILHSTIRGLVLERG